MPEIAYSVLQNPRNSWNRCPGTMLALETRMDDGKIPGEDETNVSEMTVGQLKKHVDKRFDSLHAQTSALFESLREDIRTVAVGVAAQTNALAAFRNEFAADRARYDGQLDNHEARITILERRKRRRPA